MAFRTNAAPYQRAKRSTLQIMIELLIALVIVWVAAVVYTFKEAGSEYGIKSILMMVVAVAVTAVCDVLTTIIKHKKDSKESLGKEIVHDLVHNYSWITAVIFTLTLPVWASYYVVIIGSVFATVVVKNFFGGFGRNIFNPAIMARIFVGLCFAFSLDGFKHSSLDAVTGATVTTVYNGTSWLTDLPIKGFTLTDLFMGNYFAAMGETFTLLILVLGIILAIRNVINWRTPVFYLGTVVVTALVISLVCGFENPLNYVGYHLALGGLMFGAIFMLTDPVTGPTAPFGKCLIGVVAGLITVLIRVKGGYPEGVMFSIALCNLISPTIDYLTVGKSNSHLLRKSLVLACSVLVAVGLCTGVSYVVNGGKEVYSVNGIAFDEYNNMTSNLQLKEGHDLHAKEGANEAYLIKDASGNVVAKVYHVVDDSVTEFPVHGYPQVFTMEAYVAFNLADDTVYDIAFVKGGTTDAYTGTVAGWADTNVVGQNQSTIAGIVVPPAVEEGGPIGATYSAHTLIEFIEQAYQVYASDK